MRDAAARPRSAWMRTSSRSSSEAASSLRLVKMSVTPRAIVVDERDSPKRRRWSQLCFGAGAAGATATGAGASAGGSTTSSASLAAVAGGASTGAGASPPRNQRPSRPDFPFFSSFSSKPTNPFPPPYAGAADAAIPLLPMTPEETRARLLYRDGLMLVLDKPAGVAVHAGPKGGASLEDDFDALRFGLPRRD